MLAAGAYLGTPQRKAVRGGDDLHVAAMVVVLSGPPQVHPFGGAGRADAVGLDQRAVDDHVAVAGGLGRQQRPVQAGSLRGKHVDALLQVVIARGLADLVVPDQLADPGAVEEPAQDQHRLLEAAQHPAAPSGATPEAFGVKQTGQVQRGLLAYGQRGGVCDTHGRAQGSYEVDLGKTIFIYRSSASFCCTSTGSACRQAPTVKVTLRYPDLARNGSLPELMRRCRNTPDLAECRSPQGAAGGE